jgi:putative membrane protein
MRIYLIAMGLALLASPAFTADPAQMTSGAATASKMSAADFAKTASIAGMFEVQSSTLALEKSKNQQVKEFAQMMVTDHQKANAKLKQIQPGNVATSLDETHADIMDRLKKAPPDTFDTTYVAEQTAAHQQAVDLFSGYAADGDDPALKDFAQETLPTLKSHLELVKKLN